MIVIRNITKTDNSNPVKKWEIPPLMFIWILNSTRHKESLVRIQEVKAEGLEQSGLHIVKRLL